MATVKVGQIKTTVSKAIKYITRDDATMGGVYVSTNAAVIDPSDHVAIARQFEQTRSQVGVSAPRKGDVLAHHVIQSFSPTDPVDAKSAHRLGVEFAESITDGKHEFVVATHVDKEHVHNHIIFNAVNLESGRKFRMQRDTIGKFRDVSDALCRREGLSVLPPFKRATPFNMKDIYLSIKGVSSKDFLRTEIDKAAARATDWDQFEGLLELAGIETSRRGTTLAFRDESKGRAVRDWRLGESFTEAAIMARLARGSVSRLDFDRSMIVRKNDAAFVVRVPGTRGQLHITIPRNQVVQHGRTFRAYVPVSAEHVLSDRRGRFATRVVTAGLYEWFATPREMTAREVRGGRASEYGGVDLNQVRGWSQSLEALHQLQDRVNATSRWLTDRGDAVPAALEKATTELRRTRVSFQTQLVALTDRLETEEISPRDLQAMQATLRQLERQIDALKRDVSVLTYLNLNDSELPRRAGGVTLSERIEERAGRTQRQVQRVHDAREADLRADDPDRDGDVGTRQPEQEEQRRTLQDRIQEAAARRSRPANDDEGRGRTWR